MDDESRLQRARTFDEVGELYDRARRAYPEEFFDDLFSLAGLAPDGIEVLEIGCGTGQATVPLARRGCRIVCVEMGENLARIARRNLAQFPRVTVVTAPFEEWEPRGAAFDMVFAATSWHWLDPRIRYPRAASVLRPGRVLAFTTSRHAFPPGFDSFFTEVQASYDAIGEGRIEWPPPPPEKIADAREEIERSGFFEDVRVARYLWTSDFTADEYVAFLNTTSDHRLMDPSKREWLFSEMRRLINARPGGRVRRPLLTILHVAHKKA
jgi:SAM-dependent methyltransferase